MKKKPHSVIPLTPFSEYPLVEDGTWTLGSPKPLSYCHSQWFQLTDESLLLLIRIVPKAAPKKGKKK